MTTFLNLTNKLLRRINDVELRESEFYSAKGVQATAKDAISDTIREINATKIDWPFNAVEHTQTLVIGTEEYVWPDRFNAADWNSFQLQKDSSLGITTRTLSPTSREEWYRNLRDIDYDSSTQGRGVPYWCFPSHGNGFGISPSPDKNYTLKFRYYRVADELENHNDSSTIPSRFDYVVLAGALYYMNLFKENPDGSAMMKAKFEEGIRDMLNTFLPNPTHVYDGRVNFGGGTGIGTDGYYWYKG